MAAGRQDWEHSSSEIECAHCGESFYYELDRCPNCGRSVYSPEEDEDDGEIWGIDPERDTLEEWFATLAPAAATFAGLFISYLVATVAFIGFRSILGAAIDNFNAANAAGMKMELYAMGDLFAEQDDLSVGHLARRVLV